MKVTVRRIIDAYVVYEAEVEAETPDAAVAYAEKNEEKLDWGEGDAMEYDARVFVAIDEDGDEIDNTKRGDF